MPLSPLSSFPLAFWWHHPHSDRSACGLADAVVDVQQRFNFDLVKVSPPGTYQVADYGVVDAWCGRRYGYADIVHSPMQHLWDWERLAEEAVPGPAVTRAMEAVVRIRTRLPPHIPVLQTVFSPVSQFLQLTRDEGSRLLARRPTLMARVLERLTLCTIETIQRCEAAGADGVFFAVQHMRAPFFSATRYAPLWQAYDLPCINRMVSMRVNLLHLHGTHVHLPNTPLPHGFWLHWELCPSNPSLPQVLELFPGPLALGLTTTMLLGRAAVGDIESYLDNLTQQLNGCPAMITPGCRLPMDFSFKVVDQWVAAVRREQRTSFHLPSRSPKTLAMPNPSPPQDDLGTIIRRAQETILNRGSDALIMLLRLEFELGRRLPLALLEQMTDADRLTTSIAALESPQPAPRLPLIHLAVDIEHPQRVTMALVRSLAGVADCRLLEYDHRAWLLPNEQGLHRFIDGLKQQVEGDEIEREVLLLGVGRACGAILALADALRRQGRTPRFVGLIDPGIPHQPPSPKTGRSIIRALLPNWARAAQTLRQDWIITLTALLLHKHGNQFLDLVARDQLRRRLTLMPLNDPTGSVHLFRSGHELPLSKSGPFDLAVIARTAQILGAAIRK
ncbi:hypothetical protein CCP3SC1_60015 [Gammaproteobacteria bacterium]